MAERDILSMNQEEARAYVDEGLRNKKTHVPVYSEDPHRPPVQCARCGATDLWAIACRRTDSELVA